MAKGRKKTYRTYLTACEIILGTDLDFCKEELTQTVKKMAENDNKRLVSTKFIMKTPENSDSGFYEIHIEGKAEEDDRGPVEPEIEGGGSYYVFVCGECHTLLKRKQERCPECGRKILW